MGRHGVSRGKAFSTPGAGPGFGVELRHPPLRRRQRSPKNVNFQEVKFAWARPRTQVTIADPFPQGGVQQEVVWLNTRIFGMQYPVKDPICIGSKFVCLFFSARRTFGISLTWRGGVQPREGDPPVFKQKAPPSSDRTVPDPQLRLPVSGRRPGAAATRHHQHEEAAAPQHGADVPAADHGTRKEVPRGDQGRPAPLRFALFQSTAAPFASKAGVFFLIWSPRGGVEDLMGSGGVLPILVFFPAPIF